MLISINQPAYMPWLGYFDRIEASDVHVILDHVQFEKNSLVNRNKVRTPDGWSWLSIPLKQKGKFGELAINTLEYADYGKWKSRHIKSIQANYARAPQFKDIFPEISNLFEIESDNSKFLNDIERMNQYFLDYLGIKTDIIYCSELGELGKGSEMILNICSRLQADEYLSGPFGRDYLEQDKFKEKGIDIRFHDYQMMEYPQVWPGFETGMCIVDTIMNVARDTIPELMIGGRKLVCH